MHTIHVSFMTRTKRSYLFHAKVAHLREPKRVLDSVSHAVIPGTRFQNLCRRNVDSLRGSLYMYLLSFPRFWTLSIERFWFLFWNIWNGVTPKPAIVKRQSRTVLSSVLLFLCDLWPDLRPDLWPVTCDLTSDPHFSPAACERGYGRSLTFWGKLMLSVVL